ncbi:EAL domain-containing protein [Pseudomonas stutzeri]|uniref:Bifunctional diguanylate cyclase/phosphodiesterase n=1 Tax=Stutzerimonas stutzeri TaxID=316 RepID=A0A2N8S770_STUST|nr:EAL domain-containing protein [Stutzerimonas stutzeri]MCQ4294775.1 EAL domain-containing protein [Stutzerimonas stutzeri]PNF82462.1 bifunctional diguanylate cyclase/phosphodiesterase [Stutzerimonas stutzeri]
MQIPSSGDGPVKPQAKTIFARRILPGMVALLVVAIVAAAFAVIHIARRIDQDALQHSHFLVSKALQAQHDWINRSIVDYAFWGDAYVHLSKQVDTGWAYSQANLGPSLYKDFHYEAVLVITPEGDTAYSVVRGKLQAIDGFEYLQHGLPELLARAREAVEEDSGVTALLWAEGRPALVAAAVLTTGGADVEAHAGSASTLLFVDVLDAERLKEIGEQYAVDDMRLRVDPASEDGPTLRQSMEDGTTLHITWAAAQPGRLLLLITLPVLFAVALGLGLLAWLLIRHALRALHMLDVSYARLAASRSALAESEERFRDVAEAASDWIWETDEQARLTFLSNRFRQITGHEPKQWLGRPLLDLLITDSAALQSWLEAPQTAPLRSSYRAADGCERYCRLAARAIQHDGVLNGYRGTASDITEETKAQARVQYLSQHDALTGLPNRTRLRDYLDHNLASMRSGSTLTLLYIDLDRFKPVNDTLGHAAGDEVLIGVASRLRQHTRDGDLVARLGGDEFVVALHRMSEDEDIDRLCNRIIEALSTPFLYEDQQISIGASIGVALAPNDASQANELLRCADIALYQAKDAGRGTWRAYGREMDLRLHERLRREEELRTAIAEQQLEVHYQPRYLSKGMQIVGAEALLRWHHPERGLLLPEHFIALAEETGLIIPLGRWVLHQACRQAARWPGDTAVSVNLSPLQLHDDRLLEEIAQALRENGLPGERLELEITESALLRETQSTLDLLRSIKTLGVHLAVDDFGTGYSSLTNLRHYPFDVIKIDNSFVAGIEQSTEDHSIVRALIELGRGLRMRVTAEGVETEQQLRLLTDDGCTEVQGFHMSYPLPADELQRLLARPINAG